MVVWSCDWQSDIASGIPGDAEMSDLAVLRVRHADGTAAETKDGRGIQVTVPNNRNLVPAGWYMLFVTDDQGTPSKALWVRVP